MNEKVVVNFIQDVATPHNNALIQAFCKRCWAGVKLWYAFDKHPQYDWKSDLTHEIKRAHLYGHENVHWGLVSYALMHPRDKYFIVGWANPTTQLLILLFCLLRRPYNMWFDRPHDDRDRGVIRSIMRSFFYFVLKISRSEIFCVGKCAIEYFLKRGFDKTRLINLPIFIDITKTKEDFFNRRQEICDKYHIGVSDFFLTAGSRLSYEKGFDLLIKAVYRLSSGVKERIRLLIVGKGEERENLLGLIKDYHLENQVLLEDWMEIDDFLACIANSSLFFHPARYDAYGSAIFAMALGVPVVGTLQAGASYDRIENGANGFLYDCNDVDRLTQLITECFLNRERLVVMGANARKTAQMWSSDKGAAILTEGLI